MLSPNSLDEIPNKLSSKCLSNVETGSIHSSETASSVQYREMVIKFITLNKCRC